VPLRREGAYETISALAQIGLSQIQDLVHLRLLTILFSFSSYRTPSSRRKQSSIVAVSRVDHIGRNTG
jgi:hypothetical protein